MKKINIHIIMTFIIVISIKLVSAVNSPSSYSISGIIIDKASNQPIEYANIVLYQSSDSTMISGAISLPDGSFRMENLKNKPCYIVIYFIGYQSVTINNIDFDRNNKNYNVGTIYMSPASVNLNEAKIIGTNNYIDFKIDKTVINVQEQASAEGGAVVDALVNVPSVQVDGGGNVTLRGSSSFTLLIDGQPSIMTPTDALNQIPANSVEKVEIITNPSVKYDSEGTAGIINIVLKKQKYTGTSGQVQLVLATGDKYRGNFMVSHKSSDITSRFGASFSNQRKRTESYDYREIYCGDSINYNDVTSNRDITRSNYRVNAGLNWEVDTNNILSFDVELGNWEFDRTIFSNMNHWYNYHSDTMFLIDNDYFRITNRYITSDLKYSKAFTIPGHKLDISVYYSLLNNETPNTINIEEVLVDDIVPYSDLLINSNSNRNHLRVKSDYSKPVADELTIEGGYQLDYNASNSIYDYNLNFNNLNILTNDTSFSNDITFKRTVNSIYAMLNTHLYGIGIKAGLRAEFSIRNQRETSTNDSFEQQKVNLFPSLHISKVIKENKSLSFSYSRRVNRPNQWMLLPTATSTGRNMLQIGNPNLLPDFTNSFELGYSSKTDKIMLNSQLFLRKTFNSITPAVTEKSGKLYQTYENLESELASGLELMANINLMQWWRINISGSGYYYKLHGTLGNGYQVDNENFAWNGSFRTTFIAWHNTYIEFLAIYYGPSIIPQGNAQDFYYFDFFLKRNFLNRKLTIALRSHNTFDTGIYKEDTQGVNYNAHTWFKYEGPTFMATITYRFNNFRKNYRSSQPDMNFDSGLDH